MLAPVDLRESRLLQRLLRQMDQTRQPRASLGLNLARVASRGRRSRSVDIGELSRERIDERRTSSRGILEHSEQFMSARESPFGRNVSIARLHSNVFGESATALHQQTL